VVRHNKIEGPGRREGEAPAELSYQRYAQPVSSPKVPLTIEQAKRGLAATFGVSVDAIEITIRG